MQWDMKECKSLFDAKYGDALSSRIEVYLITLDWKRKRAQYHAIKVDGYWKSLMEKSARSVAVMSHPYFLEAKYCSAFEMEAMIQILHSFGDVLAQIVNVSFSGKSLLDENKVTLSRIFRKIPKTSPLRVSLEDLYSSSEYKYVEAFCNTIKHRERIDVDYCIYTGRRRSEGQAGFRFKKFKYKNRDFEEMSFNEIKNIYRNDLLDKFRGVGIEINNFLR